MSVALTNYPHRKNRVVCPECLEKGVETVLRSWKFFRRHYIAKHIRGAPEGAPQTRQDWWHTWEPKTLLFTDRALMDEVDQALARGRGHLLQWLKGYATKGEGEYEKCGYPLNDPKSIWILTLKDIPLDEGNDGDKPKVLMRMRHVKCTKCESVYLTQVGKEPESLEAHEKICKDVRKVDQCHRIKRIR